MKNLNYQRYLNKYFDFDGLLWDASRAAVDEGIARFIPDNNGNLLCKYEFLEWDSSVLGISVARVDNIFFREKTNIKEIEHLLSIINDVMKEQRITLALLRFGFDDFSLWNALERNGWYTVDVLNIYFGELSKIQIKSTASSLMVREPTFPEAMKYFDHFDDLFLHARMYRDQNVKFEMAKKFYQDLFAYLFKKDSATKLSLWDNEEQVGLIIGAGDELLSRKVGFYITYLWEILIKWEHRNKGYARILFDKYLEILRAESEFIEIGTQIDNLAANRLYLSAGLRPAANAVTLHKWFP